jgi:catechol 2,3-dioxygenase-like lactoylglutathione lyase family enzyme
MADQPIKCVATVFLPVADQDRSLAFFRDQFGFDVHFNTDYGECVRWIEVNRPGIWCLAGSARAHKARMHRDLSRGMSTFVKDPVLK